MKKALIVANLIGFSGFLWNDIKVLQELGYEVSFAANGKVISDENHEDELRNNHVKFYQLDFSTKNPLEKSNIVVYKSLKKILAEENFDLVHCHTPIAGFITRIAAKGYRKKGLKVIYTTHGLSFTHLSSKKQWIMYNFLEKFASLFTDSIITINHEDFENAKNFFCKDVRMINGVGVDTERYHSVDIDVKEYKHKIGIPENKIVILSVGELSARKNHQIIIKALGKIENKDDYCYVICGREVAGSGVEDMLKELAELNHVDLILLGHRTDIPEIMHCSDIGAIPSVREGLGLAGIQSLCAQVPLVGTCVQGIKDYIIPGKTGILCNPYDVDEYKNAIIALSDSETRNRMKANCYEVAKQFDSSISHEQMKNIYISLLSEK